MSKIYTSFKEVKRAYDKVRKELIGLGVLWDGSKLDAVECIYEPLQWRGLISWMGFYDFDDRNIHFPAIYNGLALDFRWYDKNSALDVMRHEFGHALAHRYPTTLRKGDLFHLAFGGPYGKRPARGTDPDDWDGRCVTPYAATATREDFAETFMLFIKHKGQIPAKFAKRPVIRKKWKAVAEIVKRVAAAKR